MPPNPSRATTLLIACLLLAVWSVGMFGRGFWTPDEPREADIAWRMSWQSDQAVPLLAGEPFCEKPPLTYWVAAPFIRTLGAAAWSMRIPNLLYAIIGALCVGLLAAKSCNHAAGLIGAAVIGTCLLAYQVEIWFATDAPLLGFTAAALLGVYIGFHAATRGARLGGYTLMHAALGLGFLSKSAAAVMVPALTFISLVVWDKRWRELLRWELYAGLVIPATLILTWVGFVYAGPGGAAHLKVFFWNNLAGRFARVDAPAELQYAAAHRNSPGKYLIELPMYLFPWTFAVLAAVRHAWLRRKDPDLRAVRFALSAFVPALVLLSFAATARNVYLAPALPGVALLVAWWGTSICTRGDRWDAIALKATAALLLISTLVLAVAAALVGIDAGASLGAPVVFVGIASIGIIVAAWATIRAWTRSSDQTLKSQYALFVAYAALLLGPAAVVYPQVDHWQDLKSVAVAVKRDIAGNPLLLLAPDETTRAITDMYVATSVLMTQGPLDDAAITAAHDQSAETGAFILALLPGHGPPHSDWAARHLKTPKNVALPWQASPGIATVKEYVLPNGRRYALLKAVDPSPQARPDNPR